MTTEHGFSLKSGFTEILCTPNILQLSTNARRLGVARMRDLLPNLATFKNPTRKVSILLHPHRVLFDHAI